MIISTTPYSEEEMRKILTIRSLGVLKCCGAFTSHTTSYLTHDGVGGLFFDFEPHGLPSRRVDESADEDGVHRTDAVAATPSS